MARVVGYSDDDARLSASNATLCGTASATRIARESSGPRRTRRSPTHDELDDELDDEDEDKDKDEDEDGADGTLRICMT